MKKRLITNKYLKKAYDIKDSENQIDLKEENVEDNIEKLPKEIFLILAEALGFIEDVNKLEEEKNENK